MVGGFYWDTGDTDKVFALDMEEPLKDGVLLKERLVKSILLFLSLYVSSFFGIKMFCRVPPTGLCTHHAVWRGGHYMCWGLQYGGSKLQESSCFRDTNEFHPPYKMVLFNSRSVQFLPISNGRSTGPCRVLPREIDRIRNFAVLIDYGNGEIVMGKNFYPHIHHEKHS